MLYFRACPRCRTGTVEHSNDAYGGYLQCLNCGFMRDLPDPALSFNRKNDTVDTAAEAEEYETAEQDREGAVA